jgi:hypothetical protein
MSRTWDGLGGVESGLRRTVITFGTSDGGQHRRRGRASAKADIYGPLQTAAPQHHGPSRTSWTLAEIACNTAPAASAKHPPLWTGRIVRVMSKVPPPPPQWVLDLNSTPASKPKNASLPDPPGYTASLTRKERSQATKNQRVPPTAEEMDTLKLKKAWEVAIAPAKQLPMNAFGASHPRSGSRDHDRLTQTRHVHDRKHTPDLLCLHGLHTLQNPRPGCPGPTTHIRPVRDTRHRRQTTTRQARIHCVQHVDVSTGYLEGQWHGSVTDNDVGLAGMGERADMVRESGTERVVVNGLIERLPKVRYRHGFCKQSPSNNTPSLFYFQSVSPMSQPSL